MRRESSKTVQAEPNAVADMPSKRVAGSWRSTPRLVSFSVQAEKARIAHRSNDGR